MAVANTLAYFNAAKSFILLTLEEQMCNFKILIPAEKMLLGKMLN